MKDSGVSLKFEMGLKRKMSITEYSAVKHKEESMKRFQQMLRKD